MPWTTLAGMAGMNLGSSVIGGAVTGLMNMGFQDWAAKRQHERDLESMDHQADLNRAQYDYERMMESPTRIAQQYEQAGMNPALAMSSGATSPGMTASVSPSSAVSNPASSPFKGSSISLPSIAELQRVEHQNALDDARAARELAETEWQNHQNALAPLLAEFQQSKNYSQKLENDMKEINNLYQPLLFDSTLRKDASYIGNMLAATRELLSQQSLNESMKAYYKNLGDKVFSETLMQKMFNTDYYELGSYGNRNFFEGGVGLASRLAMHLERLFKGPKEAWDAFMKNPSVKDLVLPYFGSDFEAFERWWKDFVTDISTLYKASRPPRRQKLPSEGFHPLPRTLIKP